ncbi:uncharacterized protein K452DRAFT_278667 [Aplosporella prunicola CBS 121167]|uniref:Fungal lipase-type domain-containing protein n=1 Tax=Aplosporella prunicola CBS 121167 TaxID=1176127 RepID=A0A6A6B1F4_9PEZI|nr:uncharacterized protein K452DRAFT_278667 [Aplosporella prunicola CBS 121167]KAF2137418.1 hypothetical protein K452DRAFT_278667 [Aplosporella prunicola CBS 121167]
MKLFKHKNARKLPAASALQSATIAGSGSSGVVASASHSGLHFVDNSQGASQAVKELSNTLDESLNEIEVYGDRLEEYQDRLDREASKYSNSSLSWCKSKEEWSCNQNDADLIFVAWTCAAGAYDVTPVTNSEKCTFDQRKIIKPSLGGTTKATVLTLVKATSPHVDAESRFPVLVIAVRGTASTVDNMVNLNAAPRSAESYLCIQQICQNQSVSHVLFTGHSAGAAVTSLLTSDRVADILTDIQPRVSCITFGGPPVMKALNQDNLANPSRTYLWINVINEYDLIARADRPYIRSIVDLFRSMYGQPILSDVDERLAMPEGALHVSGSCTDGAKIYERWLLPPPEYCHYGDIIVLQHTLRPLNPNGQDDLTTDGKLILKAWKVSWAEFSQLLFGRVAVHSRENYQKRIVKIAGGALSRKYP